MSMISSLEIQTAKNSDKEILGFIHSIESFGASDGPGVRAIVFFQGCPLRCKYCQNPDTWNHLCGIKMTSKEILDKISRFNKYWGSDGGLTASGGEPMLQASFVSKLFKDAHEAGINTCLDTAASIFNESASEVVNLIHESDVVMLDIKHPDSKKHEWLTGMSNKNILDCLDFLDRINKRTWIRYVLVPSFNDDDQTLFKTKDLISKSCVERIDVLPFHKMGKQKWENLQLDCSFLESTPIPDFKLIDKAIRILNWK